MSPLHSTSDISVTHIVLLHITHAQWISANNSQIRVWIIHHTCDESAKFTLSKSLLLSKTGSLAGQRNWQLCSSSFLWDSDKHKIKMWCWRPGQWVRGTKSDWSELKTSLENDKHVLSNLFHKEWVSEAKRTAATCWATAERTPHLFQPEQLRGLHLRWHDPSHPAQDLVARVCYTSSLLCSAMVHPHHHVHLSVTWRQKTGHKKIQTRPNIPGGVIFKIGIGLLGDDEQSFGDVCDDSVSSRDLGHDPWVYLDSLRKKTWIAPSCRGSVLWLNLTSPWLHRGGGGITFRDQYSVTLHWTKTTCPNKDKQVKNSITHGNFHDSAGSPKKN